MKEFTQIKESLLTTSSAESKISFDVEIFIYSSFSTSNAQQILLAKKFHDYLHRIVTTLFQNCETTIK